MQRTATRHISCGGKRIAIPTIAEIGSMMNRESETSWSSRTMPVKTTSLAALLFVIACPVAHGQGKGRGNSGLAAQNGWIFSLAEGKRQATQTGKPMMVVIRCDP
jgi:hypothetical protein